MLLRFLSSSGTTGFPDTAANLLISSPITASSALQELCYPLRLSCVLLSMLKIGIITCFCSNSSLQATFALAVHRGMGWCNGYQIYLDVLHSFSWSYTPNIQWFSNLPGISVTTERFFQYSETINYQAADIFSSNKYYLETEKKYLEDYFHQLREHFSPAEGKKFEKKSLWVIIYKPILLTANTFCWTTLSTFM